MKVKVAATVTVILEVSAQEAAWLRDLSQNPISEGESDEVRLMRENLFDCMVTAIPRAVNEERGLPCATPADRLRRG